MGDEFYINLSDEQIRAYRNAQLVSQIEIAGGIVGICHFLREADEGKPFFRIFLEGLGVSATCAAVARFIYPVRTKDMLTFKKQNTNNNQPQMLGNTTTQQKPTQQGGGGFDVVTAVAMGITAVADIFNPKYGEQTKQIEAQANAQVSIAQQQVNLANAQNTGLVYNSLAINAKSQSDLALQRQKQTIQIVAVGGILLLGMYGIYAFSQKNEKSNKKENTENKEKNKEKNLLK